MTYVILDLEWNGARCEQLGGYFNEIIEIGAVRLSGDRRIAERFDAYIRPVVSRKLTRLVTNLTGITDEQVQHGVPFTQAMAELAAFAGEDAVVMTWSNTDLMVLIENCRYHLKSDTIPFMRGYMDLQYYTQKRMKWGTAQQVSLGNAAERLQLDSADMELHHAIDDSVLSAAIFRRVYEPFSFRKAVSPVNDEFYRRLSFKPYFIREIDDPMIRRSDLRFACERCKRNLKRTGEWQFHHRYFSAPFFCSHCHREYWGRVQAKRKFDSVELKKRLLVKTTEKANETEEIK
ncbi:MAG: exonuclease domain-containing protein [Clostridia bacterium]|nr:exonuclease domain-containing protein [Clostridia bacterium]